MFWRKNDYVKKEDLKELSDRVESIEFELKELKKENIALKLRSLWYEIIAKNYNIRSATFELVDNQSDKCIFEKDVCYSNSLEFYNQCLEKVEMLKSYKEDVQTPNT